MHLIPGDENGRVELLEEGLATFDLMQLRDGIEAFLAERPIPEGTYNQLRLIVADASVTLIEGVTFDDGTRTRALVIPSGMQTGIKVKTGQPIVAEEGDLIVTVVDFDVDQSFEIQGNPEVPNGVRDVRFRPVLNEKRRSETSM